MTVMIKGLRFTLCDAALIARLTELSLSSKCSVRVYLTELIEMDCYDHQRTIHDTPTEIDSIVENWINEHRSGKAHARMPLQTDDPIYYPVGHFDGGYGSNRWATDKFGISEYFL